MALDKIYSTFAATASSIGYSEVHGKLIAALLINTEPLSLQKLSKKTGYSLASISLSLELLELVGVIRKTRNNRQVYVKLEGDILEVLRNALLFKIQKNILATRNEFEKYKNDKESERAISILEKELRRLQKYVDELAKVKIPE